MDLDWGFGWHEQLSRLFVEISIRLGYSGAASLRSRFSESKLESHLLKCWFPSCHERPFLRQELVPYHSAWMHQVFSLSSEPRLRLVLLPQARNPGQYLLIELLPPKGEPIHEWRCFLCLVAAWYQAQRLWGLVAWSKEMWTLALRSPFSYLFVLPLQPNCPEQSWVRELPSLRSWYFAEFFSTRKANYFSELWVRPCCITGFRQGTWFWGEKGADSLLGSVMASGKTTLNKISMIALASWGVFFEAKVSQAPTLVFSSLLNLLSYALIQLPRFGWRIPDDWSHEDLLDELWFWQVEIVDSLVNHDTHTHEAWRLAAYQVKQPGLFYRKHHWTPAAVLPKC